MALRDQIIPRLGLTSTFSTDRLRRIIDVIAAAFSVLRVDVAMKRVAINGDPTARTMLLVHGGFTSGETTLPVGIQVAGWIESGSGNLSDWRSVWIRNPTDFASVTTTTQYGLYIDSLTEGTTCFSIYSAGADDIAYFAAPVVGGGGSWNDADSDTGLTSGGTINLEDAFSGVPATPSSDAYVRLYYDGSGGGTKVLRAKFHGGTVVDLSSPANNEDKGGGKFHNFGIKQQVETGTTATLSGPGVVVRLDNSSGCTATLASSWFTAGNWLLVVDGWNAGVNPHTIDTQGSELINGAASVQITAQREAILFYCYSTGTGCYAWRLTPA